MNGDKIKTFMELAGQEIASSGGAYGTPLKESIASDDKRKLGAQLLLSEVLEYVIKGLGVTPVVDGQAITDANALQYEVQANENIDEVEMLDGLADVAYTMYWNALAFGLPLEEGFALVCDNNLEKFVKFGDQSFAIGALEKQDWHCGQEVSWPEEVVSVEVVKVSGSFYAVGKDASGKVRKPSHYTSVDLTRLVVGR